MKNTFIEETLQEFEGEWRRWHQLSKPTIANKFADFISQKLEEAYDDRRIDHSIDVRYEGDPIKAFNKFIKKWCGNYYPHLIDTDEQDGQYMRDKIKEAMKLKEEDIIEYKVEDMAKFEEKLLGRPSMDRSYFLDVVVSCLITELRIKSKLSQESISKKIGTKQPGIARAENTGKVSLDLLERIGKACGYQLKIYFEPIKSLQEEKEEKT